MSKKILLIEDDVLFSELIRRHLTTSGYQVFTLENGKHSLNHIKEHAIDILMTDILMDEQEGLETIGLIKEHHPTMPIIAISSDEFFLDMAKDIGADAIIKKPITKENLISIVAQFS